MPYPDEDREDFEEDPQVWHDLAWDRAVEEFLDKRRGLF